MNEFAHGTCEGDDEKKKLKKKKKKRLKKSAAKNIVALGNELLFARIRFILFVATDLVFCLFALEFDRAQEMALVFVAV